MEKTKTSSSSSPSDNKYKLCRWRQCAKRNLKDVVSCLEHKSKHPCIQAVESCSNSGGCIGYENPFHKHSLTKEAVMKYLQIEQKKTHW